MFQLKYKEMDKEVLGWPKFWFKIFLINPIDQKTLSDSLYMENNCENRGQYDSNISEWNKLYGHLHYIGNMRGRKASFEGERV